MSQLIGKLCDMLCCFVRVQSLWNGSFLSTDMLLASTVSLCRTVVL